MKKFISILAIGLLFLNSAYSQINDMRAISEQVSNVSTGKVDSVSKWKTGGVVSVNLAQSSFTNWSAGGENSISINSLVSLFANYSDKKNSWDNMIDLAYGLQQQGDILMKTDDKIDFTTKYGRRASKKLFYSAMLNFKSQFAEGFNYPNDSVAISNFLAPAYVIAAVGLDYKPHKSFTAFASPATCKMTIVADERLSNMGAYGVDSGAVTRTEVGAYTRFIYQNDFMDKSISILSKLELFSSYLNNPENIDVNWETIINFKVNKYINATISSQLMYDDDIKIEEVDANGNTKTRGAKIQFKEVIGVGLNYKF